MQIYILRHGEAQARAERDELRALTNKGREEVRKVVAARRGDLQAMDAVWVSPLVRAQQTADLALEVLGRSCLPQVTECLAPDADPGRLYTQLQACSVQSLLLVSHQPLVGTMVNQLCGLEPGYCTLSTGSLVLLEADVVAAGLAELRWVSHPDNVT